MPDRRRELAKRLEAIEDVGSAESMFSDEVAWWVNGKEVGLAEQAAAAHRPPPGQGAKPPPTGGALARRKRFH